jgi:hypothetical protein
MFQKPLIREVAVVIFAEEKGEKNGMKMEKAVSILLTSTLILSLLMVATPTAFAQATVVRFYPQPPPQATITDNGQTFTVACVIEDVADLAGFDIQIFWDPTYLNYVSHTATVTVEDYPGIQAPSPYAGIIHSPKLQLKDDVDPVAGTYWAAFATLGGASFDGSGTAFVMTFSSQNVPFDFETGEFDTFINFFAVDLAAGAGGSIPRTLEEGVIHIVPKPFVYPPEPLLKVDSYDASSLYEIFDINVWLLGAGETDLDPFWDVAGLDVYLHFDPTLIQVVDVTLDPTGTFAGFWHVGIFEIAKEWDNVAGTVHVAYMGYGDPHTAPFGVINMFSVTFNATYESTEFPPPCAPIYLENPQICSGEFIMDSVGGLINREMPVGTTWHELVPNFSTGPYTMTSWEDNGDGILSVCDQFILEDPAGYYFDYHLDAITGTLHLQQEPFGPVYWEGFAMGGPENAYTPEAKLFGETGLSGTKDGDPNHYGNFTLDFPVSSITAFDVYPQSGAAPYSLTEGVDFIVYPDGVCELLHPLDEYIENEYVGNMSMVYDYGMQGWPGLGGVGNWYAITASGYGPDDGVWVDFNNGTTRLARRLSKETPPPNEYWYDSWFPYEIESWWATGYYSDPGTWPDETDIYANYYAPAWVVIEYNGMPDPIPRYLEFSGTYEDFLASMASPLYTMWDEAYYRSWRDYNLTDWVDEGDGVLSYCDYVTFYEFDIDDYRTYHIEGVSTDITLCVKPWICEEDPADPYFGWAPIVGLAGYPHPERDYCPWHNSEASVPLPHVVEDGVYCAPFKPLGGFIDVYVCNYPEGFKGVGKDAPADMFWPQKAVKLCANVTYAGWPEQNKDVAFEIKDPSGTPVGVWYNRTDENGVATVIVRLPWPCDDPELLLGVWKVWATVDVACIVVNDTMEFKYDYRVRIWDVETDKTEYKHCEDIIITIHYGSQAMYIYNMTFTVTAVDASGVPFGFDWTVVPVGGAVWCTYENGTVTLSVHVAKFARPPIGTIYVGVLNGFPQDGGSAETPVFTVQISILPEWA